MDFSTLSVVLPTTLQRSPSAYSEIIPRLREIKEYGGEVCIFINGFGLNPDHNLFSSFQYASTCVEISKEFLSIDESMMNAARLATRDFVLQIGDDDIPQIKALQIALTAMQSGNLDIYVSGCCFAANRRYLERIDKEQGFFTFEIEASNQAVHSISCRPETLFNLFHNKMPYGYFIVKRDRISNVSHWRRFRRTSHAYAGAFWVSLLKSSRPCCKAACSTIGLVKTLNEAKTWQHYSNHIYLWQIPLFYILITMSSGKNLSTCARFAILSIVERLYIVLRATTVNFARNARNKIIPYKPQ